MKTKAVFIWLLSAGIAVSALAACGRGVTPNLFVEGPTTAPFIEGPTRVPSAVITDAYMSMDQYGEQRTTLYDGTATFYAFITLTNSNDNTSVRADWYAESTDYWVPNFFLDAYTFSTGTDNSGYFSFPPPPEFPWPEGDYRVVLFLDDELVTTILFHVVASRNEPVEPEPDEVIGEGESAVVQCGEGSDGVYTKWVGENLSFSWTGYTGLGGEVTFAVEPLNSYLEPAGGALIEWTLYDEGSLRIYGCNATFVAPDSIGLASSTSSSVSAYVSPQSGCGTSAGAGESGPCFGGYSTTARITIYSDNRPSCHPREGVAVSISSVATTDAVLLEITSPLRALEFNNRAATVLDGVGQYDVEFWVNGNFYDDARVFVDECQIATIKK